MIRKLDYTVIQRIAAGEVIQRPANAVKELIENSIDAGSTQITVTVSIEATSINLQIQDDGCGIAFDDLPLLCERYATSKLSRVEDLMAMQTFGFRGEALASISHVAAELTVVTRKTQEVCAYRASYCDGRLKGPPQPCAGNPGTLLTVVDLFHRQPLRRSSSTNEYGRIVEILQRYALEYSGHVGFGCKRRSSSSVKTDLQTSPRMNRLQVIQLIFGNDLARMLLSVGLESSSNGIVSCSGYVSSPSASNSSGQFILFINHRLVESSRMRRAVMALYAQTGATAPWVWLSLHIPPERLDVNVHPSKAEVVFLDEDRVIGIVVDAIREALEGGGRLMRPVTVPVVQMNRAIEVERQQIERKLVERQIQIEKQVDNSEVDSQRGKERSINVHQNETFPQTPPSAGRMLRQNLVYPFQQVHTDPKRRTLDHFAFKRSLVASSPNESLQSSQTTVISPPSHSKFQESATLNLACLRDNSNPELSQLLAECILVGFLSQDNPNLMLAQHHTRLLLIDHLAIAQELFYQRALEWNSGPMLKLTLPLDKLVEAGIQLIEIGEIDPKGLQEEIVTVLTEQSERIQTLTGVRLNDDTVSIPLLLPDTTISSELVGQFLLDLAMGPCSDNTTDTEASFQKACLGLLACLYAKTFSNSESIEHLLLPALKDRKTYFTRTDAVKLLTTTHSLYKIFERC